MNNKNYNVAIVISQFNKIVIDGLLSGAKKAFEDNNGEELTVIKVPGAFEIPAATKKVALNLKPDAIVTPGLVKTQEFVFPIVLPASPLSSRI